MRRKTLKRPDDNVIDLIKRSGDLDISIAFPAQQELAKALESPLRQGVLVGDNVTDIFGALPLEPGTSPEFPLDLLAPGEENLHVAFTNPGHGYIPERHVEGDYIMIPTYSIASAIDWLLRYAREARWDVVARAMQVIEASFTKKINDDGWHTLLSAAADRNVVVYDSSASAGQFTKRLVSLAKVLMRRNAGGNTGSIKRGKLTDVYFSPEALEDIRNWGLDQLDDVTRREVYLAADGSDILTRVFGVVLHDLDEFGEGQEYQLYYTDTLSGTVASGDAEIAVGLDMINDDSFVMPMKQEITIYADPNLHRQQRAGVYGWGDQGFGVLDNRRVILLSF
jgi:hypothetical protein